jgi:hypothetical protein
MTMSLASMSSIDRCTSTATPLATFIGPADSPTMSVRNGELGCPTKANPFSTSKIPNSVDTAASGRATRLT